MKTYGKLEAYIIRAIKKGECNSGACCTIGEERIWEEGFGGKSERKRHWESPGMEGTIVLQLILKKYEKLRKATVSFFMPVCPSVPPRGITGRIFIKFYI
jgi:hypothetical protein